MFFQKLAVTVDRLGFFLPVLVWFQTAPLATHAEQLHMLSSRFGCRFGRCPGAFGCRFRGNFGSSLRGNKIIGKHIGATLHQRDDM